MNPLTDHTVSHGEKEDTANCMFIQTEKEKRHQALAQLLAEDYPPGPRYVYVHKKMDGEIFFVGNATGDQATSGNHPPYWKTYVEDVLKNRYEVEILIDNIDLESAIRIKDEIMRIFADQLINLQNFHRKFDIDVFNVYSESLKLYNKYFDEGIAIEKKGKIDQAITAYEIAFAHYIKAMNSRHYDCNEEYLKAHTPTPATKLVDRISLCYLKSNRYKDLIDFSENYFSTFSRKDKTGGEKSMIKRVEKAKGLQ